MKSPGFQQDPLSAELEDLKEEADLILCQLQTAQAQLEAEIYSHEATREENSLLLKQLHDTKSQLDSQTLSHEATREENSLLLKQLHDTKSQLDSQTLSHEATREENSLLLKELHDTKSQLDSQTLSHEATREENSLLLKELHQAQEELEKYYFYAQEQMLVLDRTTGKLSWKRDQLNKLTQLIKGHVGLQKRTLSLATRIALSSRREDGVKLNQKNNASPPL